MSVILTNPVQSLKSTAFDYGNKTDEKQQKPAFGKNEVLLRNEDHYVSSNRYVTKRVITEGAVGAIVGIGLGLLRKDKGAELLKSAVSNGVFLIAFSELFTLLAKPVSKMVDKF